MYYTQNYTQILFAQKKFKKGKNDIHKRNIMQHFSADGTMFA